MFLETKMQQTFRMGNTTQNQQDCFVHKGEKENRRRKILK
jgi:hypothetical protein